MKRRWTVYGVLAAVAVGLLASVVPASASSRSTRNVALGLGAISAYELLRGQTGPGLLLGAGAAYEWNRANQQQRAEEYDRSYGYYSPYDNGRYQGYYGYQSPYYEGGRQGYSGHRDRSRYSRHHESRPDWQRGDRDDR